MANIFDTCPNHITLTTTHNTSAQKKTSLHVMQALKPSTTSSYMVPGTQLQSAWHPKQGRELQGARHPVEGDMLAGCAAILWRGNDR